MVYSGLNSYAYWGIEGTVGSGNPSTDQNIPFNMMRNFPPPKPKYVDEKFRTFDSLEPKFVNTIEKAPGEAELECLFGDPFLLLTFFTHKAVGGSWGTGTGTITGDFTDVDDIDTLFLQYHLRDQTSTNHLNRLLKHGLPMSYKMVFDKAKLIKENVGLKFLDWSSNTQAPSISDNFHDQSWGSGVGGWANWDTSGVCNSPRRSPVNGSLTWGGSALTGLQIESGEISFDMPYNTGQTFDSLAHSIKTKGVRDFKVSLTGKLYDLTLITELESLFCDRTKQTFQYKYDTTASYNKYLQFTNAYVSTESSIAEIPEAGEPTEVTVVLEGGASTALSYSGSFLNLPDPSALISTS